MNVPQHLALIGFGEVGQTLAAGFTSTRSSPVKLRAWDRLFSRADSVPARALARLPQVAAASSMADALQGATLVVCAVTAGECAAAAQEAARTLGAGVYYLDLNSVSPATKSRAAASLEASHARFVEASVMSPIQPLGAAAPILLGGPHAEDFLPLARTIGFSGARIYSARLGAASAAKMCRSVMIKGIEALLAESLISARHYGVEQTVLASLSNLLPGADWPTLAHYMITRSIQHGQRRAEEMREVAKTVEEAGLEPSMSQACVRRQEWAAQSPDALEHSNLTPLLDALLKTVAR
jgi:3-hydroxyisobutyrate dehydrogenase-like beta-hydroxyacid dehydrogenase